MRRAKGDMAWLPAALAPGRAAERDDLDVQLENEAKESRALFFGRRPRRPRAQGAFVAFCFGAKLSDARAWRQIAQSFSGIDERLLDNRKAGGARFRRTGHDFLR